MIGMTPIFDQSPLIDSFVVRRGMRVAQLIVAPVQRAEMVEVARLDATGRATGGFGSTGVVSKPAGGGA